MTLAFLGTSFGFDDFAGLIIAIGMAVYLIYCLIRPGRL